MASWHPKQHATFRILDYRKYLAYFIIVVSGKGSERRMPKLWIECEAGADTADKKKGEPEERPHLQKKTSTPFSRLARSYLFLALNRFGIFIRRWQPPLRPAASPATGR
jgi:hypothetical protein